MERELATLVESIRNAGTKVRELVRVGFEVQTKPDRSPVTTVDYEVNRILHEMQRREFPQDGWLSEESPDDPARLTNQRVWIVDPIDGTKALVNRMPEFCISAALIERGVPVVAAILNPSTDELFTAVRGSGLFLNGTRVTPSPTHAFDPGHHGQCGGIPDRPMVDARRDRSVPTHVLHRQRTGPGRRRSRPGSLHHRAGERVGSCGRSPAHRRKRRRHQRREGETLCLQSTDTEISWRHRCGCHRWQRLARQPPDPRQPCQLETRAETNRFMTITLLFHTLVAVC